MKMKSKRKTKKYANFQLDWNFHDKNALSNAKKAVSKWINTNEDTATKDVRVKDMMVEVMPDKYNNLSLGDKCRVGKAISSMFNQGYFPELERGKKKGSTNTYHISK